MRDDIGPVDLGVEGIQFAAVMERIEDERDEAEDVEVNGAGSVPPADENE